MILPGIISCSPESIEYVLSQPDKGNAVGIVPGGAAEALESIPGKHRLILTHRKVKQIWQKEKIEKI